MTVRRMIALSALLFAPAGCENDLELDEPQRLSPPQASVVTSNSTITVHWTAVEDAVDYSVLVSVASDSAGSPALCNGQGGATSSPCTFDVDTPGQLYYVRIKSVADDGETDDDPDDAGLPSLEVRAGFPNIPRTPFTWPGVGVFGEDSDSVELKGMWFEDTAAGAQHSCFTHWDNGDERELTPCTNEDLRFGGDDSSGLRFDECYLRVCYTSFEVEADDGRRGQSYTRIVHP